MAGRAQITVRGIVQGVGFRPFVFNLAEALRLKGYVTNTPGGVAIEVEGDRIAEFIERLARDAPPLSRIVDVSIALLPEQGFADFRIVESRSGDDNSPFTLISPDISTCDDCLKEMLDPGDRRYLYPFINCTNCGPRYTITRSVPYDRPNTTMSAFSMCEDCLKEYHNPKDRRFHAQPNACPKCGPQVKFEIRNPEFEINEKEGPVQAAVRFLKEGGVVAIKGLGGFHIACDAQNKEAVGRLRERKRRSNKPFALMAPGMESIKGFCYVAAEEEELLLSERRPVVLLRKRDDAGALLPEAVSPNNRYLGFMLPYTPLHYLLFYMPVQTGDINKKNIGKTPSPLPSPSRGEGYNLSPPLRGGDEGEGDVCGVTINGHSNFAALVMTSGNMSEEPIVKDNEEALEKLSGLADAFLLHNRDIFMRVDDSVVRMNRQGARGNRHEEEKGHLSPLASRPLPVSFLRRSRGYAPEPIPLHSDGPGVMGCGADLKNTFTVTKGSFAIPSQHIGDMENYETLRFFEECLGNIKSVYRTEPVAIGHDLHPGYLSTQWALKQASSSPTSLKGGKGGLPLRTYAIQHHYAHIGSVMAEHGLRSKVIGVAFDGTGYGADGNLWGGEFLVAGIPGFERVGHFRYVPLPGGESAIREPWRAAVSYLLDAAGDEAMDYLETAGFVGRFGREGIERTIKVCRSAELAPLSSGAGRLFDAVAALIGLCDRNTFEGEAAIALESLVREGIDNDYPVNIVAGTTIVVDFSQTVLAILSELSDGLEKQVIATKFHNTIAGVILRVVARIAEIYRLRDVALSGGTFQNAYLLERSIELLTARSLNVFINEAVPCNDACISLGQAYLVRERMKVDG